MSVRVSPYLLSLIDWADPVQRSAAQAVHPGGVAPACPIIPSSGSTRCTSAPTRRSPGLTHRYVDKALFLALDTCPVYCRFCTRSYAVGIDTDEVEKVHAQGERRALGARVRVHRVAPRARGHRHLRRRRLPAARRADHRDRQRAARASRNIRRIRFATKGPAVMPQKILTDDAWIDALTARRREGAQAAQGGRAAHALQPPERDHRHHRRRDEQAVRARHHRAQPVGAAARRQRRRSRR